jgi:hypothetical protein
MKKLTRDDMMDWWLKKYHDTTCAEILKAHPEMLETDMSDWFYKTYAVTKAEHDEWYRWVIDALAKERKISKRATKRLFVWEDMDLAPSIK